MLAAMSPTATANTKIAARLDLNSRMRGRDTESTHRAELE